MKECKQVRKKEKGRRTDDTQQEPHMYMQTYKHIVNLHTNIHA